MEGKKNNLNKKGILLEKNTDPKIKNPSQASFYGTTQIDSGGLEIKRRAFVVSKKNAAKKSQRNTNLKNYKDFFRFLLANSMELTSNNSE